MAVCLSVCMPVCLPACLSACLSVCLSVLPPTVRKSFGRKLDFPLCGVTATMLGASSTHACSYRSAKTVGSR
eukprot:1238703-Lingulodinium_polyedra.AAC.1